MSHTNTAEVTAQQNYFPSHVDSSFLAKSLPGKKLIITLVFFFLYILFVDKKNRKNTIN